jgi:hypothetical protein
MKEEEFRALLTQVADWIIPENASLISAPIRKRGARKSVKNKKSSRSIKKESHEFLDKNNGHGSSDFEGEDGELFAYSEEYLQQQQQRHEQSKSPMLTGVHCASTICEDCDKVCAQGRVKEKRYYLAAGTPHWRTSCLTCGLGKDPYTGVFSVPLAKLSSVWNNFVRSAQEIERQRRFKLRQEKLDKKPSDLC